MLRDTGFAEAESRFQIVRRLGSGGYGAVFEAVDARSDQRVALKLLDNTSADSLARFKQEFRALADCHHPNLVALKELIEREGRWLIVMELVEGSDLLTAVRAADNDNDSQTGGAFDEQRLRRALVDIVEGLRALHGMGVLHRDLKPSNVRVRPDGRAVLLDFGLVTSIDQQQSTEIAVGTVRYMAPEQVTAKVTPAADLYALGVCLFEALTGRAPFEGKEPMRILLDKQRVAAPRASTFNRAVPRDLDELCARLLATNPLERPSANDVLRALGVTPHPSTRASLSFYEGSFEVFAGREAELEHLERALARTQRGELRIVLVEGESGVGKSELVAHFVQRARAGRQGLVALRGRCYENEQVAYKAFDGCIDELAKVLRKLSDQECAALLPVRATLLGQLFPVLRNVPAIEKAPRDASSADPSARRLEGFRALAALLNKMAEERPLVLVVDDLQWADVESFRLLSALVDAPDRPPLLLLATVRPRDELEPDVLEQIELVRKWKHTGVVQLFGLPRAQAKALAARLLGPDPHEEWLDMIADESDGHPLFLGELVEYTREHELGPRSRLTLDAALRARIDRLSHRARELLEMVAVAARPYGSHVFARALSAVDVDETARPLLASKLLKLRRGHELGCYHDRIRRTVVELIPKARLPVLHAQLAAALSNSPDTDPAEQARHWDLAGERECAVATYETAVARCLEALAFTRAAVLCARAIELTGRSGDERAQRLMAQRAHALACVGRSGEAAKLYTEVADRSRGELRIRLRSRAAQQLMLSGKLHEGFTAARALLAEFGIRVPVRTLPTLLRLMWDRLCLALTPDSASGRKENARDKLAIAVLDDTIDVISQANPLAGVALAVRAMRLLTASDSMHARALSGRGWLVTVERSLQAAQPLFERSRALLKDAGPLDRAHQAALEGSAHLAGWDWVRAGECLDYSRMLLEEHSPDRPWQITDVRFHLGVCWYHLGDHARLARETDAWIAEARERGDRIGIALLSGLGFGFIRHLMQDEPERAIAELDDALVTLPERPLSSAGFGQLLLKPLTLLYRGGPAALHWIDAFERLHGREFMMRSRVGRELRGIMRGLASIAAYPSAAASEREVLVRSVQRVSKQLARRASPYTRAYARLLSAQLLALTGDKARALADARLARTEFQAIKHGHVRLATYLEGLLEGGSAGREKCEGVVAAYLEQGWRFPLHGIYMNLPAAEGLAARPNGSPRAKRLVLGRYEVRGPLPDVGDHTVMIARDAQTGRDLALKELVERDGVTLERFKREFRTLQELNHPNICRLEALFEYDDRWYMAMELPEGSSLVPYVRPAERCDPARLRSAFVGVARALAVLHEAGFLHLELTPTSVRVQADGRVLLVDFGSLARTSEQARAAALRAPQYAAPELLAGATPDASADVYALGACLYEALHGEPPFPDSRDPSAKRRAPERRELSARLEPLGELCREMLAPASELRPTIAEVLGALSATALRSSPHRISGSLTAQRESPDASDSGFAGREAELAQIANALERTCDDGFTLALVEGESGVGKSALMAEFARQVRARWPAILMLTSRCYENEQVAFKAFDGAVDQLASWLRQLPNPVCEALLPKRAALLAQLFPVLSSVPAIESAPKKGLPADPAARQLAARECFILLLENLCARHELLLLVDDLQWADSESFALLSALVRRASALPFLFVATTRPESELDGPVARAVGELAALPSTERIALSGLSDRAAGALARELYDAPLGDQELASLVRESRGHPLFLRELVTHKKSGKAVGEAPLTLDGALEARIAEFSSEARELLALVAIAARPLGAHVIARAMQRKEAPRDAIIDLLAHGLLRRRGEDDVACYHDRIRRTALAFLDATTRRELSRRLATALEGERSTEAAELARLWDEANDRPASIAAYERAGALALESLVFTRAEQHYARALELLAEEPPSSARDERQMRITLARGHALSRAGRPRDAARAYQAVAEKSEGEAQVRLRILAARHLLQSADLTEGMQATELLLRELGVSLPRREKGALMRIAWERARVGARGTTFSRRQRTLGHEARLALEALGGLSSPVRDVSYLPGSTLVAQYLRRALASGDPNHASRALAYEALWRVVRAPGTRIEPLFAESESLAETSGDPALIAEVALTRGMACMAASEFKAGAKHLWHAQELLQTRCPGEPWMLTSARRWLGASWFYSGEFGELMRYAGPWLDEARAREDRYAVASLLGFGRGCVRHLLADQPDVAKSELEQAMASWPKEPFSTVHFGAAQGMAMNLGYVGGSVLLSWMDASQATWQRAFLMRTPACRWSTMTFELWALSLAIQEQRGEERQRLLARLERGARLMKASPAIGVSGVADLHLGLVHYLRSDRDSARASFHQAAEQLGKLGHYFAPGARYLEGALEGGDAGREKQERALAIVKRDGWADVMRGLGLRTPGVQLLL